MFLRRSKSTRAATTRIPRDQVEEAEHPLPTVPLDSGGANKVTVEAAPPSSRAVEFLRMARRKSVSHIRNSSYGGGLGSARESKFYMADHDPYWEPPKTATLGGSQADKKRRSSIFWGASPSTSRPTSSHASKRASRFAAWPPRSSSVTNLALPRATKASDSAVPQIRNFSPEGDIAELPVQEEEASGIGMALGSPSEMLQPDHVAPSVSSIAATTRRESPDMTINSRSVSRGTERSDERSMVSAEPKKSGWASKLFRGRKIFRKKGNASLEVPVPPIPSRRRAEQKLEQPTRTYTKGRAASPLPMLDVDIPSVQMERYSVMFGSLLPPSEKSTLYARRKSREASSLVSRSPSSYHQPESSEPLPRTCPAPESITPWPSQIPTPPAENPAPPPKEIITQELPAHDSPPIVQQFASTLQRSATTGHAIAPFALKSPLSKLSDDLRRLTPSPPERMASPGLKRSRSAATSPALVCAKTPPTEAAAATIVTASESSSSSSVSRIDEIEKVTDTIETTPSSPGSEGSFERGDDGLGELLELGTGHGLGVKEQPGQRGSGGIEKKAQISIARQISLSRQQLLLDVVPENQRMVDRQPLRAVVVQHRVSRGPSLKREKEREERRRARTLKERGEAASEKEESFEKPEKVAGEGQSVTVAI